MYKVWVVGHRGMLGKAVTALLWRRGLGVATGDRHLDDWSEVSQFAVGHDFNGIINCAGVRPGTRDDAVMVRVNALLPHYLARRGIRMVHMSTDCVYSGKRTPAWRQPDPADLYGRTKLAGESDQPHVLNVRGSFIGPDHGFLRWLLDAEGTVDGWANALWTGTTVGVMAETLVDLLLTGRTGTVHAAAPAAVTKDRLAVHIVDRLGLPVTVIPKDEPRINRALPADVTLPPVYEAVDALLETLQAAPL